MLIGHVTLYSVVDTYHHFKELYYFLQSKTVTLGYILRYNFEVSLTDKACFLPNSFWYTCTM